jgi:hypothetical protein
VPSAIAYSLWSPSSKPSPKNQDIVHLATALSEGVLRPQVKQCGGRWNPQGAFGKFEMSTFWLSDDKRESLTPKVYKVYREGIMEVVKLLHIAT